MPGKSIPPRGGMRRPIPWLAPAAAPLRSPPRLRRTGGGWPGQHTAPHAASPSRTDRTPAMGDIGPVRRRLDLEPLEQPAPAPAPQPAAPEPVAVP